MDLLAMGQAPRGGNYKLLHLIHSRQRRGAEVFALQLARSLSAAEFNQAFCSVYGSAGGLETGDFPFLSLDAGRSGIGKITRFDPVALLRLVRLVRKYRPHLIVAHGADTLKYAALARPFLPSAVCMVYRNIGFASYWAGSPMKARLHRSLLRYVDSVISVGERSRQNFVQIYRVPESKAVSIPNAVDVQPFTEMNLSLARRRTRRRLGLEEGETVAIFVGNLSEEKNPQELLEVLARLIADGIQCRLLIVGQGPLRGALERDAAERGISGHVLFLGSSDDVPSLLASADLLLLPSRTESMPAVVIEAGLAGLPSVAYEVGDVGEVIEPGITGFVVRPGNREAFAEAVATALQDPKRREAMGEVARQRCALRFDIRPIAAEYRRVFLDLLDDGRRLPVIASNSRKGQL